MIEPLAWCDGTVRPAAEVSVSAFDRTLLYGLGAFETVRLHGGRPFLLERHLKRLAGSLEGVGLSPPDAMADLPEGVVALARQSGMPGALCRITVTAGPEPGSGLSDHGMRVVVGLRAPPAPPRGRVVEVGIVPFAVEAHSPIAGIKSTSYLVHYLLRDRAHAAGREDDLMIDPAGHVTEASVSNVFAVRDGVLRTPPASEGILPGVTRGVILELAADRELPVDTSPLTLDELRRADECFLTGAGKCLLPVDRLEGRTLPGARPVATLLAGALRERIADACGVDPGDVDF